jgi:hypothetical protein
MVADPPHNPVVVQPANDGEGLRLRGAGRHGAKSTVSPIRRYRSQEPSRPSQVYVRFDVRRGRFALKPGRHRTRVRSRLLAKHERPRLRRTGDYKDATLANLGAT